METQRPNHNDKKWKATKPFLIFIRDIESLEKLLSFRFSIAKLMVFSVIFALVFVIIGAYSHKWLLSFDEPEIPSEVILQNKVIELAARSDSFRQQLTIRDKYLTKIRTLLNGGQLPEMQDHHHHHDSINKPQVEAIDLDQISEPDMALRREFESNSMQGLSLGNGEQQLVDFTNKLFPPIEGLISAGFNEEKKHYGIDLVARVGEPVKAVADGTVIMASWTDNTGYVLAIQHENNLISVYKHNESLEKHDGDFVKTGEVIGFVGNTGKLTTGPHLHLELWLNGVPVDPKNFIKL